MFKRLLRSEKGFTLIELMVVLLIIGILVAIAIPVYNATQTAAKEKTCKANLRTLDGAIAAYQASTDVEPGSLNALVPDYLKAIPSEPTGGSYSYSTNANAIDTATCSAGHTYP